MEVGLIAFSEFTKISRTMYNGSKNRPISVYGTEK